jgi:hypothetical protein
MNSTNLLAATLIFTFSAPQSIPVPNSLLGYKTVDAIEIVGRYYIHGTTDQAAGSQTVYIDYIATLSGPREQPLVAELLSVKAEFAVTATAVIDPDHIAVGGQESTAQGTRTIVEIWALQRPSVQVVTNPATGTREHTMSVGQVTQRQRVFEALAAPGREGIRRLVKVRGVPTALFVQFHDSGDLCSLDWSAIPATVTRVLSPVANSGVPHVPGLNETRFQLLDGRTHSEAGCMYVLGPPSTPGNADVAPFSLVLFDNDCNGTIDSWSYKSPSELSGFYDSGYREIGLATRY